MNSFELLPRDITRVILGFVGKSRSYELCFVDKFFSDVSPPKLMSKEEVIFDCIVDDNLELLQNISKPQDFTRRHRLFSCAKGNKEIIRLSHEEIPQWDCREEFLLIIMQHNLNLLEWYYNMNPWTIKFEHFFVSCANRFVHHSKMLEFKMLLDRKHVVHNWHNRLDLSEVINRDSYLISCYHYSSFDFKLYLLDEIIESGTEDALICYVTIKEKLREDQMSRILNSKYLKVCLTVNNFFKYFNVESVLSNILRLNMENAIILKENGVVFDDRALKVAFRSEDLELVKFVHKDLLNFKISFFSWSYTSTIEILKYALEGEHNVRLLSFSYIHCLKSKYYQDNINYLISLGVPIRKELLSSISFFIEHEKISFLFDLNLDLTKKDIDWIIARRNFDLFVKMIKTYNIRITKEIQLSIALRGTAEMLDYTIRYLELDDDVRNSCKDRMTSEFEKFVNTKRRRL